jgi:hypothetical protein
MDVDVMPEVAEDSADITGATSAADVSADIMRALSAADVSAAAELENGHTEASGEALEDRSMENGALEHGEGLEPDAQGLLRMPGYLALDDPALGAGRLAMLTSNSEETAGAASALERPSVKVDSLRCTCGMHSPTIQS